MASSGFHRGFRRDEAGISTVEGEVSGARASRLAKKRKEEQEEFEAKKSKIESDLRRSGISIGDKFGGTATDKYEGMCYDVCDSRWVYDVRVNDERFTSRGGDSPWECASKTAMFKAQTVGLVSAADFKRARVKAESASVNGAEENKTSKNRTDKQVQRESKKKRKQKAAFMSLSFGEDIDEGVQTVNAMDNESAKNGSGDGTKTAPPMNHSTVRDPSTDTSFLPDRERDARMEAEKSRLRKEWMEEQEIIKKEELEVVYSYWDGSGHRRQIVTAKGTTIAKFLEMVRCELAKDFIEMKSVSSANLMYIKVLFGKEL